MSTFETAKVAAGLVGASAIQPVVQSLLTNEITTPIIGVPVTVVGSAALGALLSLNYKDPEESRSRLFGGSIVATILGSVAVAIAQHGVGWKWVAVIPGPMAVAISFVLRLMMPTLIHRTKDIIKKFSPVSLLKKDDGEGQ